MASGFITLKDGRCFAPRWTGYDELIRVVIQELAAIENSKALSDWLKMQIPETEDNDEDEMGWGFNDPRIGDIVSRDLDIRSLTVENQQLFWEAIKNAKQQFVKQGDDYSNLSMESFNYFYKMFELCEKGEPPLEFSDWSKLADPCTEKKGPGWD